MCAPVDGCPESLCLIDSATPAGLEQAKLRLELSPSSLSFVQVERWQIVGGFGWRKNVRML